ncbi:hypothetical protein HYT53_03655 [Candidatus Woesearchaeota archaeon]|nr:hypothetical protein [Candidatus Woesearchaeota archaeon]
MDIGRLVAEEGQYYSRLDDVPFGQAPEDGVVARIFQPDTLLPEQYLETFRRKTPKEPGDKLRLAVLEDAIMNFQKYLKARDKRGRDLDSEAEGWILDQDGDSPFSFETVCEVFGMNPDYVRQGLMKWKERQLKAHPHYHSKPKKSKQDIGSLLTDMQKDALREFMIAACNPTIKYSQIIKRAKSEIGARTNRGVEYFLRESYYRFRANRMPCYDMPSAIYIALHYGILNLNDIQSQKLKSLEKGVEMLTRDEKRFVRAYGKLALSKGRTGNQYVKVFLRISRKKFATRTKDIYEKFGVDVKKKFEANTAYLAIAAYYLDSKSQVKKPCPANCQL